MTLMGVMLMGKLRGLPAHTDVVAGFRFGRVVRERHAWVLVVRLWRNTIRSRQEEATGSFTDVLARCAAEGSR